MNSGLMDSHAGSCDFWPVGKDVLARRLEQFPLGAPATSRQLTTSDSLPLHKSGPSCGDLKRLLHLISTKH